MTLNEIAVSNGFIDLKDMNTLIAMVDLTKFGSEFSLWKNNDGTRDGLIEKCGLR